MTRSSASLPGDLQKLATGSAVAFGGTILGNGLALPVWHGVACLTPRPWVCIFIEVLTMEMVVDPLTRSARLGGTITVNPSTTARVLVTIAGILVFLGVGASLMMYVGHHNYVYGLVPMFHLNLEGNVPAFFSAMLLFLSSLLLAIIASVERSSGSLAPSRWTILAGGFFLMAVDEWVGLHELLIAPVGRLTGEGPFGTLYFAWILPATILVLILGCFFVPFLRALPVGVRTAMLWAASLYLGGSLGFEALGGAYYWRYGPDNLTYDLLVAIEESLEMFGVILFIRTLLVYARERFDRITIQVEGLSSAVRTEVSHHDWSALYAPREAHAEAKPSR